MHRNSAQPITFKLYRVAWNHDDPMQRGWCVFEQTKDNKLTYVDGPFASELRALDEMDYLNRVQGLTLGVTGSFKDIITDGNK